MLRPPQLHSLRACDEESKLEGHSMSARFVLAVLAAAPAACGRSSGASDGTAAERPPGIALPGDPGGAFWDAATASLYVTDAAHDAVVRWRDRDGVATELELPSASAIAGSARSGREAGALGGVVRLADGRFVIATFGFGEGTLYVASHGDLALIGHLDRARRRTALALAPDGAIYSAYFVVAKDSAPRGGISRIDPGGGEIDVVTSGLRKPVGLAATAGALFVVDEHQDGVRVFARSDGAARPVLGASLASPVVVAALPGGDAIAGTRDGLVHRVSASGARELGRGFGEPRGLAYDGARNRLFVVAQGARLHTVALSP